MDTLEIIEVPGGVYPEHGVAPNPIGRMEFILRPGMACIRADVHIVQHRTGHDHVGVFRIQHDRRFAGVVLVADEHVLGIGKTGQRKKEEGKKELFHGKTISLKGRKKDRALSEKAK